MGDVHLPWGHRRAIDWALTIIKKEQPDLVIQIGDYIDLFCMSRFPRSHNLYTPANEMRYAREQGEKLWADIQKLAPKARCVQLLGNHMVRAATKILSSAPELETLTNWQALVEFKNVELIKDPRKPFEYKGLLFEHGFSSNGKHAPHNHRSTTVGHTHRGGTWFYRKRGHIYWELNCGFLADEKAAPLSYTSNRTTGWTLGLGIIDDYGPRFVPFPGKP